MSISAKGACWRPLLFWLLAMLAGPAIAGAAECTAPAHPASVSVRYVIDGDTVILTDGRHIRLIGLNAPEIGHDGNADQPFARAARDALQKRIKAAHGHLLLADGPEAHDPYHRELSHLFTPDGTDLSAVLLRQGLASLIAIPPNITRLDCYLAAETAAREHGRGLWAKPSPLIFDAGQITAKRTGFAIVRGNVTDVHRFHAGTRLELSHKVWLWIPRHNRAAFDHKLASYRGRKLLARGWLHPYHGHPEMVVHAPGVLSPAD